MDFHDYLSELGFVRLKDLWIQNKKAISLQKRSTINEGEELQVKFALTAANFPAGKSKGFNYR